MLSSTPLNYPFLSGKSCLITSPGVINIFIAITSIPLNHFHVCLALLYILCSKDATLWEFWGVLYNARWMAHQNVFFLKDCQHKHSLLTCFVLFLGWATILYDATGSVFYNLISLTNFVPLKSIDNPKE